jgi:hypothetical protein
MTAEAEAAPLVDYKKLVQGLDTYSRLIEHTERVEPKDYTTTLKTAYVLPETHAGGCRGAAASATSEYTN